MVLILFLQVKLVLWSNIHCVVIIAQVTACPLFGDKFYLGVYVLSTIEIETKKLS